MLIKSNAQPAATVAAAVASKALYFIHQPASFVRIHYMVASSDGSGKAKVRLRTLSLSIALCLACLLGINYFPRDFLARRHAVSCVCVCVPHVSDSYFARSFVDHFSRTEENFV